MTTSGTEVNMGAYKLRGSWILSKAGRRLRGYCRTDCHSAPTPTVRAQNAHLPQNFTPFPATPFPIYNEAIENTTTPPDLITIALQ